MVDGKSVLVKSALVSQPSAPTILVFIVHSLTANDVTVNGDTSGNSGGNAFALVSEGDVRIGGVFNASAISNARGPGAYDDAICGGKPTGTPTLIPLRGGCDSGRPDGTGSTVGGAGGGAIQLVSRTRVSVTGVIAANGNSIYGGGSGGGILIEAPAVEVTGSVVANGGAGSSGCLSLGEDGRLDATPALGGTCANGGAGGNGGASAIAATGGTSVHLSNSDAALAGHGGGGVGRIRINAAPGGFHRAGLFSPDPSTGAIATR